ncbi:hypothetical protein NEOKW01_0008 [Nematocida sp. AWRm80]|nr:hypothetical protein NEOKW01_0008 [Nematocida sp. AWRm80]
MDRRTIHRFCEVLLPEDQQIIMNLLVEYALKLEKLSALAYRAEEYKLILKLSQNKAHYYHLIHTYKWTVSVLIGIISGIILIILVYTLNIPLV